MNIFVCVKQVPDTETKITLKTDKSWIETDQVKWIMNPYDEFAVEQALLFKEKNPGTVVTVIRVGAVNAQTEILRTALAMGADQAILIENDEPIIPSVIAGALNEVIKRNGSTCDLVLTGKQAIDTNGHQVPQMLASLLDIPAITDVVKVEMSSDGQLTIKKEGISELAFQTPLPVLISCSKGLNTPRYPTLPGIMQAKKKPLTKLKLSELNIHMDMNIEKVLQNPELSLPQGRGSGKIYSPESDEQITATLHTVLNELKTQEKIL